MSAEEVPQVPQAQPPALRMEIVPRMYRVHLFSEHEVDDLASIGMIATVFLAFFSLFVGLATSFGIVVFSPEATNLSDRMNALYATSFGGAVILGALCGIVFGFSFYRVLARRREMKARPSYPLGNFALPIANPIDPRSPKA